MSGESRGLDTFAAIAEERARFRDESLTIPGPLVEAPPELPAMTAGADVPIAPRATISTEADLARELERLRAHYRQFAQRLSPEAPRTRSRLDIRQFAFRHDTEEDRRDFVHTLSGGGCWETVAIPHYGPPLGRAVTYYRTELEVPAEMAEAETVFLCFRAVDYRAHVFLNGSYLGSHEGFFAPFEFDATPHLLPGSNTLLVKVENDAICMGNASWEDGRLHEGDKIYAATGLGYDDPEVGWHHCPPGMGICQGVYLEARPRLHVADIFVRPQLDHERAEVWVEVRSVDLEQRDAAVSVDIYGSNFQDTVLTGLKAEFPGSLGPGTNLLRIPVSIPGPRLWSGDSPWLYEVQIGVYAADAQEPSDVQTQRFGMRSFTMDESGDPKGELRLNGQPIRLRGANTMGHLQQCVLRGDWEQLCDDILLCKAANMNFLRLTQRPVQAEVYEFCDRLGMMTQTDLPLFGVLRRNQFAEAVRQAEEMERLVRPHPCNISVSYINEPFPNARGRAHRFLTRPELESFFDAASHAVRLANPDRVIKPVDGDYDPPAPGLPDNHCYCGWYNGHGVDIGRLNAGYWQAVKPGWYYGCGEFGSEGLDPVELMRRRYPPHWLPQSPEGERDWTPDSIVKAQSGRFQYLWYERPRTLDEWVTVSRQHQARVTTLMTEAFRRDRRMISFAIHLSIDAFPSGWMKTIMDCERRPKPAYFAYREACEPILVSLRTDRFHFFSGEEAAVEIWVCNDRNEAPPRCRLRYRLEDEGGTVIAAGWADARVPVNSSECQGLIRFALPAAERRRTVRLLAALTDEAGRSINDNSIELEVFPAAPAAAAKVATGRQGSEHDRLQVSVFSGTDGEALRLCRALGIRPAKAEPGAGRTLLIDDYADYDKRRAEVDRAVGEGATAVLLRLQPGEYRIGDADIRVRACTMNPRHFVARDTGHALVAGFEPNDFRFWHDVEAGTIAPFLHAGFVGEGWAPILTSGDGAFTPGAWTPTMAAAERRLGTGAFIVCQIELANRVNAEPVAREFAARLIGALP